MQSEAKASAKVNLSAVAGFMGGTAAAKNAEVRRTSKGLGKKQPRCSCAYVSANGNCKTVVTSGAEFCGNHSCPSCTAPKPSKSVTCPSCATRSIKLAGQYHQTHPPLCVAENVA